MTHMTEHEEVRKRIQKFVEDMEKLGVKVQVTITVDLRRRA